MDYIVIDFETRSKADLSKCGAWVYSEDPSTDIFCMAYRTPDMDKAALWVAGDKLPKDLFKPSRKIVARNALFEYAIVHNVAIEKYGFPVWLKDYSLWVCTAALSRTLGLPGSLEGSARVLKTATQKLDTGAGLIEKYSKPFKDRKSLQLVFRPLEGTDRELMFEYCRTDVDTDFETYQITSKMANNELEREVFLLDFAMNNKGINIDQTTLKMLLTKLEELQSIAEKRMETLGCNVRSPKQMKDFFKDRGIKIPNLQEATVLEYLPKMQDPVLKELLELRLFLGKSSVKKFSALDLQTAKDGRLRHMLLYFGAHTGRWAGRGFQPHNLPRTKSDCKLIEEKIKTINTIIQPMEFIEAAKIILPGLIIPDKGNTFVLGDFAAIEARGAAYIAGETKLLKAFANDEDVYKIMASTIYKRPVSSIGKDSTERQVGKTAVLGSGYGAGWCKIQEMCAKNGVIVSDKEAQNIVMTYREYYSKIPQFWRDIERAFLQCHANRKKDPVVKVGKFIKVRAKNRYVAIQLPSKREIFYHEVQTHSEGFSYLSHGRNFRVHLYGGILTENIVQALCRDIFADRLLAAHKAGLDPVLHTHDDMVCQVPAKDAKKSQKIFDDVMNTAPAWVPGFPLKTESEISKRYHK